VRQEDERRVMGTGRGMNGKEGSVGVRKRAKEMAGG